MPVHSTRDSHAAAGIVSTALQDSSLRLVAWRPNLESAELRRLKAEWEKKKAELEMERDVLKRAAPDLVRRNFTAVAPDVLWCGDVTQIDTDEGPLSLATTEDLFSRRMLGHAMSAHHDAALVIASLQMAVTTHGGDVHSRTEARIKISTWIADFYNTTRRHSANDGLAPITFEHQMAEARRTSTAQPRVEVA